MDRLPAAATAAAAAAAEGKDGSSVEFGWTNEKHANYLHSLEVSFVKRFFGSTAADHYQYYHLNGYDYHNQPLDRHLPDSCDSTLDSTTHNLNHAKQSCCFVDIDDKSQPPAPGASAQVAGGRPAHPFPEGDADPHHSKARRSKKSKKRRTSPAQKAPQEDQVQPESVTGSSSGRGSTSQFY